MIRQSVHGEFPIQFLKLRYQMDITMVGWKTDEDKFMHSKVLIFPGPIVSGLPSYATYSSSQAYPATQPQNLGNKDIHFLVFILMI